ncbi:unnamed protein product [Prunus armeniaca]
MSRTLTILLLIADSKKHVVNPVGQLLGLILLSPPPKVLLFIRHLKNPHGLSTQDILTGKTIGCGTRRGKLYYLDWASDSEVKCDTCELAKSHRVPFPLSSNKSLILFFLVHSDVWGLAKIATPAGARWFVMFIDDCTRMTWVSLLKTKGEVSSKFQQFYQMVET